MRRTTVGALLAATLLAGPAAATAAAQVPVAERASVVQAVPDRVPAVDDRDKDDGGGGGWGLWGLAGLLGLLGLLPRRSKGHTAGGPRSSPGTGGGAHPTDRI
ncbi:hypothetical protein RND61_19995 [Streptomyces sp. TRM76323]|uniref:MYXO-CTERM domain-containing protein n=1 Tax=Streptomyces tamarix TaxID=3078565 RepID=A0ABU3QNH2_9ACTN|nr:hypothetical protein [Streptomyces tamarix]MDT9684320.1 hypothetical protein [Streptomyces tamarix]